jgi:hypothetical protein
MGLSLFENSREINTSSAVMMVEDVLIALGHFVNDCRVSDPQAMKAWRVAKPPGQHAAIHPGPPLKEAPGEQCLICLFDDSLNNFDANIRIKI